MAISHVGNNENSASPNTDTVVTLPGTMQADDLIIALGHVADTANNGLPAPTEGGYTRIGSGTLYSSASFDCNLDLYYKFHNGTDISCTFSATGGSNASNIGLVSIFRGVALVADGGPFDTAVTTATGTASSNADPPSHNWSGGAGVWIVIAAATGHAGGDTALFSFPTGYAVGSVQRAHADTIDGLAGMGYNSAPSDPEDPGAFTATNVGTQSNNAWAAATMSLKPAGAGAPATKLMVVTAGV